MKTFQILMVFSALILWGCATTQQTVSPEVADGKPQEPSAPVTEPADADMPAVQPAGPEPAEESATRTVDEAREQVTGSSTEKGKGYPYGDSMQPNYWKLDRTADSPEYGRSENHPILVGRSGEECSPSNERYYLNALLGPNGETVQYERIGSCCAFETTNSPWGAGLLDVYQVTYEGLDKPITLYINMYDPGEPLIPVGFTARSRPVAVDYE